MSAIHQLLPAVAVGVFVLGTIGAGVRPLRNWHVPALVCLLFLGWSLYTVAVEGPWGFWPNHTQNAWGNQVWFDLLIAVAIGWTLILPRARAVGMQTWPWLALICATGCIGLSAMFARCLFLEHRQA